MKKILAALGVTPATGGVLVSLVGLGLAQELWRTWFGVHLQELNGGDLTKAVMQLGVFAAFQGALESVGYLAGGSIASRLGPRRALAFSAVPVVVGFAVLAVAQTPWLAVTAALLVTSWDALSLPATFDAVGSSVAHNRRTSAFAVQSITKRLPRIAGPLCGAVLVAAAWWAPCVVGLGCVLLAVVLQAVLLRHVPAHLPPPSLPLREVMRGIPHEIRTLLAAELLARCAGVLSRDFAILYLIGVLAPLAGWSPDRAAAIAGFEVAMAAVIALVSYLPVARLVDRASSPRPAITMTFLMFAVFPAVLALVPVLSGGSPTAVLVWVTIAFVFSGLREVGEPARKAYITTSMPPEIRARAVGAYWATRTLLLVPMPLGAAWLWIHAGPERCLLIGAAIALLGCLWWIASGRACPLKSI